MAKKFLLAIAEKAIWPKHQYSFSKGYVEVTFSQAP